MMNILEQYLSHTTLKYVIHETYQFNNINTINDNSIIFFDDCLYSQYIFIKNNINILVKKNILCILGFSTGIHRISDNQPIINAQCADCHTRFHNNDLTVLDSYMSLNEILELLTYSNILLAAHGHNHLNLETISSKIKKTQLFNIDIKTMYFKLNEYKLCTNIFIFPYAYDDVIGCYSILNNYKFKYIFAGKNTKRIPLA